jgi:alpha-ketoglutarate-dependent 2,4-dichlorophenoxyacetate dioxygenase
MKVSLTRNICRRTGKVCAYRFAVAQKLLAERIDAATSPGLSYVHIWRNGDVVMWDNRATMHRGRPWPAHEARLMVRTTISGTEVDGLETVRLPPRA